MIDLAPTVIYTDGGCHGNPGPGGWGFLLLHTPSGKALEAHGAEQDTTNNRMEMMAAIQALSALKPDRRTDVEIRSDSKYVVEMCRSWIYGWEKRGWKRKAGKIENLDLVKMLWTLIHRHNVAWTWVRGHTGEPGNEYVDKLATRAITHLKKGIDPNHRKLLPKSPL